MDQVRSIEHRHTAGMSNGRLIYLMGPSGSGKDSLIGFARARLTAADKVIFSHRYITRSADPAHENFISLTDVEFDLRVANGLYLFDWAAHSFRYAVGIEVRQWLAHGLTVVISGSRAHFPTALRVEPRIIPVLIDTPLELLRQRLIARGRESPANIERRLKRGQEQSIAAPGLVTIHNDTTLEAAGSAFLKLLRSDISNCDQDRHPSGN